MKHRQRCDNCKKKIFRVMIDDVKKQTEVICHNCEKIKLIHRYDEK